jgi:hypothetical protein
MPTLPGGAIAAIPSAAQQHLVAHGPFETYSTVSYSGTNGGVPVNGLFVEVDEDTWIENNTFTFQEVKDTKDEIILYDASRDTTVFINLVTNDVYVQWSGNELVWDVTGVSQSLVPVIPDGWLV